MYRDKVLEATVMEVEVGLAVGIDREPLEGAGHRYEDHLVDWKCELRSFFRESLANFPELSKVELSRKFFKQIPFFLSNAKIIYFMLIRGS
jgi:hypothetical protein